MIYIILVALALILAVELARVLDKKTSLESELSEAKAEYADLETEYFELKERVDTAGLLHAPIRVEVVVGTEQFPSGHIFKSTREALRALGRDVDGKLPKADANGFVYIGGLTLRRVEEKPQSL